MKTWLSWSTGKDSAWALHQLKQTPDVELTGVFTTINQQRDRVAMHGTRDALLQEQVKRLGLLLYPVYIPEPCDNETYQQAMQELIDLAKQKGIEQMAFGDLFLADIRAYREKQLIGTGIRPIFPLWQQSTGSLAKQMITAGVKAVITCVDTKQLPASYVGREFDLDFLADLPGDVDPCGENGEFHTFVYDGPIFDSPIPVKIGKTHESGQFLFIEI